MATITIRIDDIESMSPAERGKAAELAIGRILRMGARPAQPGDVVEYERCRAIVIAALKAA